MKTIPMVKRTIAAALAICTMVQAVQAFDFQLRDSWGREVRSQDYKGRPIFLEFGACW